VWGGAVPDLGKMPFFAEIVHFDEFLGIFAAICKLFKAFIFFKWDVARSHNLCWICYCQLQ